MEHFLSTPWSLDAAGLLKSLETTADGLSKDESTKRQSKYGLNEIQSERPTPVWQIFLRQFTSPLVLILIGASLISFALGERTETLIIIFMVLVGGILAFVQEYRSEQALHVLRKKMTRYARVLRNGKITRIDARLLVPGDIVALELGSVIPADLRLLSVEDLQVDESIITGESVPVPKITSKLDGDQPLPQEQVNMAFTGTHVVQGSGIGVVVGTGMQTEFGRTASLLAARTEETDFQKGIRKFGNFLLKITLALTLIVAIILGLVHGNWAESLLFALALAVGISPELLPVIVTINLSRGAIAMSKKQVLVKRLIAIEDLGNADVFCTDKTGTLTVGKLRVRESIDPDGKSDARPLSYAVNCLDASAERATNPLDQALLETSESGSVTPAFSDAVRHEIVSFDFTRRRMSCIVSHTQEDQRWMIVKGATEEVIAVCTTRSTSGNGDARPFDDAERKRILACADSYHDQGYRLLAIARRPIDAKQSYAPSDEKDLELLGFVLVSDAPKVTAKASLIALENLKTRIVILTGDNERVTLHVANQLGFAVKGVLTGDVVEKMDATQLEKAVEVTNIFARITPGHKLRVIQALKKNGHTVGFMGDGVNDAPALRAADVGISFDDAVDVAKEAAGVILLQKKLSVLAEGIREGRKTFINTRTYLRATIASNFGNMLSVAGAALILPFIPLLPAQILLLNLLSDLPMLCISADNVSDEDLSMPRKWDIQQISNFMYFFGTISSLADYATFAVLLFVARADVSLFRSSWFLESVLTEIIVIFLLRTRKLSFSNPPGLPVVYSSLAIIGVSFLMTQTSLNTTFNLVPLPTWIILAILGIVAGYAGLTELGKIVFYHFREQAKAVR